MKAWQVAAAGVGIVSIIGFAVWFQKKPSAQQTGERIEPFTGSTWHAWAQDPSGESASFDVYVGPSETQAASAANAYELAGWRAGYYSA